jgi:hypothetical protein
MHIMKKLNQQPDKKIQTFLLQVTKKQNLKIGYKMDLVKKQSKKNKRKGKIKLHTLVWSMTSTMTTILP